VATSLKGKGVVAEGSELALGSLGVTSRGDARDYIERHADLLIFLGAGFNERTSYLWDERLLDGKHVVQVDRDAAQLGRVFCPDVAILGDIREVVDDLTAELRRLRVEPKSLTDLKNHRYRQRDGGPDPGRPEVAEPPRAFDLIGDFYDALARRFPRDAIVFDDNIVFAQRYFDVSDGNHYFPNSGISSLGHAIPAAIGARFHAKESPLFAILGDGGFQMCCMEIMTAVNYDLALNVVVINNATMGLIRKNQFQLYGERYIDCDFVNPDFAALAAAFGISHYRINDNDAIDRLFADADLQGSINLIEIPLDKHAFPNYLSAR
jgi:acetolactate synthase-1/2/3 large subunit